MKPAARLNEFGQSAWLDLIGRKLIHSGELKRMAEEDGVRGVTANPAIFEKAIVESNEYDDELSKLIALGKSPLEIYETLAIADVTAACDVLRPWFEGDRRGGAASERGPLGGDRGQDGFVSLEVSPYIARDTKATVAEAKRFWKAVDRPNLFIKIPANPEGIPAIREATAAGISINITLIFSVKVYDQVIDAYISGLEERVARGEAVSQIHSVASFFVSRVDTAVDKLLEEKGVKDLQGKIAVANAKEAYQLFLKSIASPRWKALEAKGATRQRPLWASTGTKNKAYSDVLYVEPLIGRDTVNTLPLATLHAFNDHGKVAETVTQGVEEARAQLRRLAELGIDLEQVCRKLTDDGLDLFSKALDGLLAAIEARSAAQKTLKQIGLVERLGRHKKEAQKGLDLARSRKIAFTGDPQRFLEPLAALLGIDVAELRAKGQFAALASRPQVPLHENLAVRLGAIGAGLAQAGVNKLTLLLGKGTAPLGPWIAELLLGTGMVPVLGEPPGKKDAYGSDRLFVSLSLASEAHDMTYLAEAGHPVLQWQLPAPAEMAAELVRWEIASSVMRALLPPPAAGQAAPLPGEPALRSQGLALFASPEHAMVLRKAAGTLGAQTAASPSGWIAAHLALGEPGDYVVLIPKVAVDVSELTQLQGAIRDVTHLACTSLPAPPSGLPPGGLFLQLTGGDAAPEEAPRLLRVHVEDGKPDKVLEALRGAIKLLSK